MDFATEKQKLDDLQDAYENGEAKISDSEFDKLVAEFEQKFSVKYNKIGAVPQGEKTKLAYYMGSLDKAKGDKAADILNKWKAKYNGPYVISDKLDGNAGLYIKNGTKLSLFTRGDGTYGRDISHLLPYLHLPAREGYDFAVKGELIMSKVNFALKGGSNPRNIGSGIINSKTLDATDLAKIDFLAYGIFSFALTGQEPVAPLKPSTQFHYLKELGFKLPGYVDVPAFEIGQLTTYLEQRKAASEYEIDGIVITDDKVYEHLVDENPDHQIAYKVDTVVQSVVTGVEWNASKDGKLKPIIHFEMRNISGADCSKASGDNAKFIIDNKIGPGAQVLVTRSGDVIPRILKVLSPGVSYDGPRFDASAYRWNESGVEFVLIDPDAAPEVRKKKIEYFIKHMGIEAVGPGRIELLFNNGFDTISKLITMKPSDISGLPGLGVTSATTICDNIRAGITNVPGYRVMTSSGCFGMGFGDEKMKAIMTAYPDIFYKMEPKGTVTAMLKQLGGFDTMAETFELGMPKFLEWLGQHPQITIGAAPAASASGPMKSMVVLFTGFGGKDLIPQIEARGGIVKDSYSAAVTLLVTLDSAKDTAKLQKAREAGKHIMTLTQFKTTYGLQ